MINWLQRLGILKSKVPHQGVDSDSSKANYWIEYLELIRTQPEANTPIAEIEFVVLDTETTGSDHNTDRVVSFAGVKVKGNAIDLKETVDWKIKGYLPSDATSIEIHGVLNRELESGLREERFIELMVKYVGSATIVGYCPGFDMAILNRLVREYTGGRLTNKTLDVFDLGMRVDYPLKPAFVNPEKYRLDRLCKRYEVEQPQRHTAMGDAYATALLLLKILNRLEQQGVKTYKELMRSYG